ncbi:MAG: acetyl-CoA carboxylase biotin carboxyl carrier protein [Bacteriovoracaceae bacterium]|jgi:acetyl-CoA carboxylase biotin carboxyl carrier protein|nr:acetyl-CoA carboxylase, biotin carboxyl carrier protein [Halobacteriovoraceae bacterium]MDP7321311.1 acetyl-CoA carboxylase biotin carboxyl carrier protein [Bacteriovoracaceae bacterium]|tara:strand:- start:516 stop:953 length:438 start_codon:yes stop_codon:yes gene_type:complete
MNLENIKKFIDLAKNEGVAELKYEEKDLKISVNFNVQKSQVTMPSVAPLYQEKAEVENHSKAKNPENFHEVTSPFVGTYYGQSAPGKPAFVKVGDKVSKGQTLCILEAMKIMNEIESDVSGEIVEVCVDNESLVEFGQTLFKVRV